MTNTKLIINRDNQILNIFRNIEIYLDQKKLIQFQMVNKKSLKLNQVKELYI